MLKDEQTKKTITDIVIVQAEHTEMLRGIFTMVKEISATQDKHTLILNEHTQLLNEHTVLLKEILSKLENIK